MVAGLTRTILAETNLKKQGMLPLTFVDTSDYDKIREDDVIEIQGLTEFKSGQPLFVELNHIDGTVESFPVNHTFSEGQIAWFRAGSALNIIKEKTG